MENHNIDALNKQISILKKRLERSEQSRKLTEQAMDHYDLVYRSSIQKLDAQKNLLDIKNSELDLVRLELIVKNKELIEASTIDGLTRIYNRKKICELLDEAYLMAQRDGIILSVIIIDIDHFKLVNDTFGHQVGDQVLFELAQLIKDSLHVKEHIGRWGGEEFLMVLPNACVEMGYVLAERIRLRISRYNFPIAKHLTCSFGITEYKKDDRIEQLIKRADIALYQAKEYRNHCCVFK
ncbi:MAG: hypothetical protein CVU84_00625 [Firmicutes bacterium HGW-Firmicutes-1]|jgi:diguanylate cyclase (GGDEF)-like protein|nr:MAG: hypothetical protein CVU84_00625 [Firmicutes bacterium HGW-Firmicutes-1]